MNLLDDIRECLATVPRNKSRIIKSLPTQYSAIALRDDDKYGVAIEINKEKNVSEKFSSCELNTQTIYDNKKYLVLSCKVESLRYEFASVCAEFLEPGKDGSHRKEILDDPFQWWTNWCKLMGNTFSRMEAYSVIAEMLVLEKLFKEDKDIEWTAVNAGSHDIESNQSSFEVKSTIKRYEASITISSQHQLKSEKALYLYFCRLEKSKEGLSINDVKDMLINDGYDEDKIEYQLSYLGYNNGASIREEKYKILEKRRYIVDDKFPRIVDASFKDDHIPDSVIKLTYTVDLDGLQYDIW
ncbi:PD-(D/E)XK motif protein [Lachnospira multipara]|uniref:PD-(D/E)XK motif protein n=1 Tax=Lachnospira multipara TaxID=28051 RepID=UPI00048374CD|nr:PD-(D/E)XK motif protein [Lachnospira multipara]